MALLRLEPRLIDCSSFLIRTYPTMKKHNPHVPILIREAQDVEPKVWARYGGCGVPRRDLD